MTTTAPRFRKLRKQPPYAWRECRCGHVAQSHGAEGCYGLLTVYDGGPGPCACPLTPAQVQS